MNALARLARSPLAVPLRALANLLVGSRPRVVTIRGGTARGLRAELDLRREKAFWLGHYEPPVQAFLRAHVRPGDVVYDVGANVGFFSLCAVALGARVYAFEVDPGNAERLRRNASLNGAGITVVEAAAWDSNGLVAFVAGPSGSEGHVHAGSDLPAVTLDSFAAAHEPPTVVKIDVEGAERRVLRGARAALASVRALTCEVHEGVSADELCALLPGLEIHVDAAGTRITAQRSL